MPLLPVPPLPLLAAPPLLARLLPPTPLRRAASPDDVGDSGEAEVEAAQLQGALQLVRREHAVLVHVYCQEPLRRERSRGAGDRGGPWCWRRR